MHLPSSPVIGCAAGIAEHVFAMADLRLTVMKSGLDECTPKSPHSRQNLMADTAYEAKRKAASPGSAERKGLQEFVRLVAARVAPAEPGEIRPGTPFWQLYEALRADGFDLHADHDPSDGDLTGVRLLPLDEPAAPLSTEITALEADSDRLGTPVAKNACRQAADSLVDQRFEAAISSAACGRSPTPTAPTGHRTLVRRTSGCRSVSSGPPVAQLFGDAGGGAARVVQLVGQGR
ncbi:hypothetical protein ACFYT4_26910 [Streptomyces sp. NPDC004609]|uniref:hypothetical protein n=1 Tax=Streptomyces sp. NPDC004609 TaxID=3364704 RepID=UPI0036B1300C